MSTSLLLDSIEVGWTGGEIRNELLSAHEGKHFGEKNTFFFLLLLLRVSV